jgi:RNA polymerase sigma factor (sigma-70 family)
MDRTPSEVARFAELAAQAVAGSRGALRELCLALQGPIYRISLEMLRHPADAEDAAQEILVKVITGLGSFEGRSSLFTWVHRIAVRHLLRMRASRVEKAAVARSAEEVISLLDAGVRAEGAPLEEAELRVLSREVRVGCVNGMLQSLSRIERAAYLLSEVLGLDDETAAEICEVEPAAFRQRLSRARHTMESILFGRCGLVSESSPCRCAHQAAVKKAQGWNKTRFLTFSIPRERTERAVAELSGLGRAAGLFRAELVEPPPDLFKRLTSACPELLG